MTMDGRCAGTADRCIWHRCLLTTDDIERRRPRLAQQVKLDIKDPTVRAVDARRSVYIIIWRCQSKLSAAVWYDNDYHHYRHGCCCCCCCVVRHPVSRPNGLWGHVQDHLQRIGCQDVQWRISCVVVVAAAAAAATAQQVLCASHVTAGLRRRVSSSSSSSSSGGRRRLQTTIPAVRWRGRRESKKTHQQALNVSMSLLNVDRFSKFFHWHTLRKICDETVIQDHTIIAP